MIKTNQFFWTILFLSAITVTKSNAQITDGPYVFYKGDNMVIKSVQMKNGAYIADSVQVPKKDKTKQVLNIHLDGHPEWDFIVKLKDKLISPAAVSTGAEHTVVLSDIEGEFEPFRNLLLAAKVIDHKYNWMFGNGNLVIAGDLFDRGKQVSQFLWLLYKLEDEASSKGGAVHVILGNHDIMNLDGNFGYVQAVYNTNAQLMRQDYSDLYANHTELGRWLRSKNIIEQIGDLLVMHAGMSKEILQKQQAVQEIDDACRPFYDMWTENTPFAVQPLLGDNGIFWYRGYFLNPLAPVSLVDSTLDFYRVKKIVVGHDIIDHVAALYNGKVIGVDVDEHTYTHEALLIDKGKYYRMDDKGNKTELLTK